MLYIKYLYINIYFYICIPPLFLSSPLSGKSLAFWFTKKNEASRKGYSHDHHRTILICTPVLSLHSFYAECTISTPCDSNPSYAAHFLHGNNSILLSASCTAIFFLPHTLSFVKKEILFTTSALCSYHPSFLLPFRKKIQKTHVYTFSGSHQSTASWFYFLPLAT